MDTDGKLAFESAVNMVNDDPEILRGTKVMADSRIVPEYESFQVGKTVCSLMSEGVAGIIGPKSQETSHHVQSLCDTMEIPHITTRFDANQRRSSCLINLYPHPSAISKAIADIVSAWKWDTFTILYDDYNALKKVNNILKLSDDKCCLVSLKQLPADENYRSVLKEVKHSGEKNLVIECSLERLYDVLIQAQQVGLVGAEYSYIVTSLDFHSIDLEPFKWGGTNITGIRLVDPDSMYFKEIMKRWQSNGDKTEDKEEEEEDENKEEALLIHDAVFLFAKAMHRLELKEAKEIDCETGTGWDSGYTIINFMKMSQIHGLSGLVKFDHQGFRTDINLDVIELKENGFTKRGTWNITEGLKMIPVATVDSQVDTGEDLRNTTFIVLIALTHPYGMLKESHHTLKGNDRFEGFCIDLIHELSLMSGFNYTFKEQEDKSSGNPGKDGKWTGMIGEVLAGRADLAIADITITREREAAADFTMPFMNLGISILYKKPKKAAPSLFSFLSPFSYEVWGCMMAAYLGVSLLLFVMGRISPYEWTNPYPCIEEPEFLESQFSLANSLWFTIGSLMQQGSELAPVSVSTRMVAAIWWFFTLIMVSSYTANLAAFLTIESTVVDFRNVEESKEPTYQKMWQFMESHPEYRMGSNDLGVQEVLNKDKYAFLMESTSIEYEVERNVVKLQEAGRVTQLKNKWWKEKRGGGACQEKLDGGAATALDLENVGGVFVVLLGGCIFSIFLAMGEVLMDIYSREDKVSFKEELMEEIRFITRCHGTTKPVRRPKEASYSDFSRVDRSPD
ncbi:hypothetical protein O3M35_003152 [Rhynocoris fuscipes]|uniref:Uncharacterized protein n=1 Tax=Rhynocoris fuscipes TaxID=488301 RepID=A0AAW1CP16_9HEMI